MRDLGTKELFDDSEKGKSVVVVWAASTGWGFRVVREGSKSKGHWRCLLDHCGRSACLISYLDR